MTTKCPDAIGNKKVQRLSEHTNQSDLFLSLPVFDITTKLTYRNRFCAICNGATNITYWKFSAEECDNTKLKLFMNKTTLMESIARYCKSYSYNLPTLSVMKHLKYCLVNKEKSCSRNNSLNTGVWNLNKQLCRSYSFPVYTSNGTFLLGVRKRHHISVIMKRMHRQVFPYFLTFRRINTTRQMSKITRELRQHLISNIRNVKLILRIILYRQSA